MTHLLKVNQNNIFEAKVPERVSNAPEEAGLNGLTPMPSPSLPESRFAIAVDMTPEEARQTRNANYPKYDWPSVKNLPARTRGKHY